LWVFECFADFGFDFHTEWCLVCLPGLSFECGAGRLDGTIDAFKLVGGMLLVLP
jgi:hypothetical protein